MAYTYLFNAYNPGPVFSVGSTRKMRFLDNKWSMHNGQDFPAPIGTSVSAAATGVVYAKDTQKDKNGNVVGWGNYVVIKHTPLDGGPAFYSLYAHLNEPSTLVKGNTVEAGVTIGLSGNSGHSFGPHLHFEIISEQPLPLSGGRTTLNPLTFTGWGDLPHMIGTDDAGNAIVATTISGVISCKAVDTTGTMIAGTASSNSDLPGITTPYASANPGTQYWAVTIDSQAARLYDNGVIYAKDLPTGQEYWDVPTSTGGYTEVTKFGNGVIITQTFAADGSIDTAVPGTITLDASASTDIQAAFNAWKAKGGDPANIPGANIYLDQTLGGTASLLDARRYTLPGVMGTEVDSNDVLVGEGRFDGKGGNMMVGGMGGDVLATVCWGWWLCAANDANAMGDAA